MIFITGAAGKTGRAILNALKTNRTDAVALVRNETQASEIRKIGDFHCILGDLRNIPSIKEQIGSIDTIYYICPNVSPDELDIGKNLLSLAQENGVNHFIYHSVLHPQVESMPHHWMKMRMEEAVLASGLDFTILQPCAYMQNILAGWNSILNGTYQTPYRTSARLSIVDLEDVAEVAVKVMTEPDHLNAIYELCGPAALSQEEISRILSWELKITVNAVQQPLAQWRQNAAKNGMMETQIEILCKMFAYYDQHGLIGNSSTLKHLLGRSATTFSSFVQRILQSGELS